MILEHTVKLGLPRSVKRQRLPNRTWKGGFAEVLGATAATCTGRNAPKLVE